MVESEQLTIDQKMLLMAVLNRVSADGPNLSPELTDCVEIGPNLRWATPDSTNAVEILQACGLPVRQVEQFVRYGLETGNLEHATREALAGLCDRMTQRVFPSFPDSLQNRAAPQRLVPVQLLEKGRSALEEANELLGLGLEPYLLTYFADYFQKLGRNPSLVELFLFGGANSEHCRHHVMRGAVTIDGVRMPASMMDLIRKTTAESPLKVLVAYVDNAAILQPFAVKMLHPDRLQSRLQYRPLQVCITFKVETHNHPTAIEPYDGEATGMAVIRDVLGAGNGAVPLFYVAGTYVDNLLIPGHTHIWEVLFPRPAALTAGLLA